MRDTLLLTSKPCLSGSSKHHQTQAAVCKGRGVRGLLPRWVCWGTESQRLHLCFLSLRSDSAHVAPTSCLGSLFMITRIYFMTLKTCHTITFVWPPADSLQFFLFTLTTKLFKQKTTDVMAQSKELFYLLHVNKNQQFLNISTRLLEKSKGKKCPLTGRLRQITKKRPSRACAKKSTSSQRLQKAQNSVSGQDMQGLL